MEIYVGNLSYQATEGDIEAAFGQHGVVDRVQIIQDKFTGRSKGFAFVSMSDWKEAQAAIKALDGAEIVGRVVKVNQARPREERSQSGGGGGGYRGQSQRGSGGYRGSGDRSDRGDRSEEGGFKSRHRR